MHCIIGGLCEVSASYAWMEWLTSVESWLGLTCLHESALCLFVLKEMMDVPILDSLKEIEEGSCQQGTESWSEPCYVSFISRTNVGDIQ